LLRTASVQGPQDADTTQAAYLAGKAAMIIWSSFLLDELAELSNDARPNCPQMPRRSVVSGHQQRDRDRHQRP
jgi:multiple sugar transport system substrate-binding protein